MDRRERIGDEEETLRAALDGHQAGLWTAMPAMVTRVNLTTMTIEAQPTIKGTQQRPDGTELPAVMPLCVDVPIVYPSGGGFTLTFPIAEGDECLLVFASRCIDAWWQLGGVQPPLELRMHDLSDGFALVGPRSQPRVIGGVNSTATQLRSDDGQTFVEVGPGKIQLVADEVVIHGRQKTAVDCLGNGFVWTPTTRDDYAIGTTGASLPINPPEVPT